MNVRFLLSEEQNIWQNLTSQIMLSKFDLIWYFSVNTKNIWQDLTSQIMLSKIYLILFIQPNKKFAPKMCRSVLQIHFEIWEFEIWRINLEWNVLFVLIHFRWMYTSAGIFEEFILKTNVMFVLRKEDISRHVWRNLWNT